MPRGLKRILKLAFTCLAIAPASAEAVPSAGPNVRPFFSAGLAIPVHYAGMDHGFGVGMGLEIEESPTMSLLFRADWNTLRGKPFRYPYSYRAERPERTAVNWALGTRIHARTREAYRPYLEVCWGARFTNDSRDRTLATERMPKTNGMASPSCSELDS